MSEPFRHRSFRNYAIVNAEIWTEKGTETGKVIVVEEGRLREIAGDVPPGFEIIDAEGAVLMPAGVDAQVHLRVPGQLHKETPETGLLAALRGGYAAVLTMPNTQPTIDAVEVLEQGRREVAPFEKKFGVKVFWTAAITKRLNSDEVTGFEDLVSAGVRAFTNDGLGVANDQVMDQAFGALAKLGVPLLQHAEVAGHGGALAPGPAQKKVNAKPYFDDPEWKMVERDLRELRKTPGARYHVLHVSSAKTVDLVREAKREGLKVSCEVTPHHLYFNVETLDPQNPSFKMNPPIRSAEDQKALWAGLADGTIDFVATDHAPHEASMKTGGFDTMAFGTLGLETTMNVLVDGLNKKYLNARRLVEVWSGQPARFLDLPAELGGFVIGAPFHAVWVDVQAPPRVYAEDQIASLSKNSCFIGTPLPGRVRGAFHAESTFTFP